VKALKEVLHFLKTHWLHILLVAPAALIVTILHESAHAAVVLAQGGSITEFVWLPTAANWGHINYAFPKNSTYSSTAISVAPYLLWTTCCLSAIVVAIANRRLSFCMSSTIFIWLFLVPLADIANAAIPYLLGDKNDFLFAFGKPNSLMLALIASAAGLAAITGFYLQKRLYQKESLGILGYSILGLLALGLILLMQDRGLFGEY
jgi:hypothetical protein